jgi:hypothetical protein
VLQGHHPAEKFGSKFENIQGTKLYYYLYAQKYDSLLQVSNFIHDTLFMVKAYMGMQK